MNQKNIFPAFAATIALTIAASAAHAVEFEFNFADGLGNREATGPITYEDNGIEMTVSALANGLDANVHINGDTGLGVAGSTASEGNRIGPGEALVFDFTPAPVNLLTLITFDTRDSSERLIFDLFVDDVLAGSYDLTVDNRLFVSVDVSDVATGGSSFAVAGRVGDEGFRLTAARGVLVSEPGILALVGFGGLALAATRRRRRAA